MVIPLFCNNFAILREVESLISSVLGLKLKPSKLTWLPFTKLALEIILLVILLILSSLNLSAADKIEKLISLFSAVLINALTSFGKQDPP